MGDNRPSFDALTYAHPPKRSRRSKARPAWEHKLGEFQRACLNACSLYAGARRAAFKPSPVDHPEGLERWCAASVYDIAMRVPRSSSWSIHYTQVWQTVRALVKRRRLKCFRAPRRLGNVRASRDNPDRYGIVTTFPNLVELGIVTQRRAYNRSPTDVPHHLP